MEYEPGEYATIDMEGLEFEAKVGKDKAETAANFAQAFRDAGYNVTATGDAEVYQINLSTLGGFDVPCKLEPGGFISRNAMCSNCHASLPADTPPGKVYRCYSCPDEGWGPYTKVPESWADDPPLMVILYRSAGHRLLRDVENDGRFMKRFGRGHHCPGDKLPTGWVVYPVGKRY